MRAALEEAGGRRVQVVPATAHELTDEPTRALLLAARLRAAPWRLPEILGELLRADDARWVYGAEISDLPDPTLLTVPVAPRRAVRLRRTGLPFTLTEAARAAAFARLAQPPAEATGGRAPVRLTDGAEVQVRPITTMYRGGTRHARTLLAGGPAAPLPHRHARAAARLPSSGCATAPGASRSSPATTGRWWRSPA